MTTNNSSLITVSVAYLRKRILMLSSMGIMSLVLVSCTDPIDTLNVSHRTTPEGTEVAQQDKVSGRSLEKNKDYEHGAIKIIPLNSDELQKFRLKPISASSLPKGMKVKEFATMEEAKKFIAQQLQSLSFQAENTLTENLAGEITSLTDDRVDEFAPRIHPGAGYSNDYGRGMGVVDIVIQQGWFSNIHFSFQTWLGAHGWSVTNWDGPASIYMTGVTIGWSIQNFAVTSYQPTTFTDGPFTFYIDMTVPFGIQIAGVTFGETARVECEVVYNPRTNRCRVFSRIRWD